MQVCNLQFKITNQKVSKNNPSYFIILLTYYGGDCRLDFEVPTIEEIKGEAYLIINHTPEKKWINDTDPKIKQVYDSSKINLPKISKNI